MLEHPVGNAHPMTMTPPRLAPIENMHQSERIAIVGLGGIFPGAPDLDRYWANVAAGVDSPREVPPGRWLLDVADAYDPRVGAADRVYSTRGGFVEDFRLDPEGLDLDPD